MGYAHQSAGRRFLPLPTAPRHTCIALPYRLIARVGVSYDHVDAQCATCVRGKGKFTLVSRSMHSVCVGATVNLV
jgi:hypothetical protein